MEDTDSKWAPGGARAPFPVAYAANRTLSPTLHWSDCDLAPGVEYRLTAIVEGADNTEDVGALIAFDVVDPPAGGAGLRMSSSDTVPPHIYFRTGPGLHRTDRMFTLASPARRFGVMAWHNRGQVTLKTMTIEPVTASSGSTNFFLSFDVEADPDRAFTASPIEGQVWGRINGGEYGIRRICDVLEQHGVVANFMVDFATCAIEGDRKLAAIVDFLGGRGHEIHMHLHPDRLAPAWGLTIGDDRSIKFDSIAYDMSRRLLDYTLTMFERFAQRTPRVFRSGAYRMNADLVLAAGSLGIEALTNVRRDIVGDPALGGDLVVDREPFVWDNGVVELPVDISSPEAGSFEKYLLAHARTIKRKRFERTYNLVMHSWSLTRRNADGVHDAFEPEYEARLHEICEHATQNGRVRGYGEYLDQANRARPVVRLSHIRDERLRSPAYESSQHIAECNICDMPFSRSLAPRGLCPACGLGMEQRSLKHVLDNYGSVVDGRNVLVLQVSESARRVFPKGAAEVQQLAWSAGVGVEPQTLLAKVPDAAFDGVVGFDLPYAATSSQFLDEVARVLRPGGVLVAVDADAATAGGAVDGARGPSERAAAQIAELASSTPEFSVSVYPGLDPVTRIASLVLLAYRNDSEPVEAG